MTFYFHIVTSHYAVSEKDRWVAVKVKLIGRYKTLLNAARDLNCHVSSLRLAVSGLCPDVEARMRKKGLL
jgi:hypothetical protein